MPRSGERDRSRLATRASISNKHCYWITTSGKKVSELSERHGGEEESRLSRASEEASQSADQDGGQTRESSQTGGSQTGDGQAGDDQAGSDHASAQTASGQQDDDRYRARGPITESYEREERQEAQRQR